MTETEPVTLEEEYEMQQSWINDEDSINIYFFKIIEITFIISINDSIIFIFYY